MSLQAPRTKKMSAGLERVFRAIPNRQGYFREITLHWIHFIDPSTGNIVSSKLDRQIPGGIYKIAAEGEHSLYGECEYMFPDGIKRRLIGINERMI